MRLSRLVLLISFLFLVAFPGFGGDGWIETKEFSYDIRTDKILKVVLDIDMGEVDVIPSDTAGQCLIRLSYYPEEFIAKVNYKENSNELKVRLDKKGWKSDWDSGDEGDVQAEIFLPKDVDMTLETRVKAGEVSLDLTRLRLKAFKLSFWAGEVGVQFNEPNPVVMDYMDINARIGQLSTSHLGNARYKKARINGGIGEIDIDLTGEMINESKTMVDLDIGEAEVTLPASQGFRLSIGGALGFMSQKNIDADIIKRGSYYYSNDYKIAEKSISVRITTGLGELTVNRE
jgi:predicted membrane protein